MIAAAVITLWLLAFGLAVAFTLASVALFLKGWRKATGR